MSCLVYGARVFSLVPKNDWYNGTNEYFLILMNLQIVLMNFVSGLVVSKLVAHSQHTIPCEGKKLSVYIPSF